MDLMAQEFILSFQIDKSACRNEFLPSRRKK
jgi:hypothetical protein